MKTRLSAPVLVAALALGCGGESRSSSDHSRTGGDTGPLSVYVVSQPLATLAERVGGEDVRVVFPAPPGEDPAAWRPSPETVVAYQGADLILLSGAGYATWVSQASLPTWRLIDTGAAYEDRLAPVDDAVTHTHGPEGEDDHGNVAFTTWLDPTLALEQARAIAAAFERARPERGAAFRERLEALEAELLALDERLREATGALGDTPILFSHPVYQYLQRRYDLNGRSVHWEPGEEPIGREWRKLGRLLPEHPARWMVWESTPLPSVEARLEEMGIRSVVLDPGGSASTEGDWLTIMDENVDRLGAAWSPGERGD